MCITLAILGIPAILTTAATLLKKEAWWIRIFDFPRTQITIIALIILGLFFFWCDSGNLSHHVVFIILALSILYQLRQILRYTPYSDCRTE